MAPLRRPKKLQHTLLLMCAIFFMTVATLYLARRPLVRLAETLALRAYVTYVAPSLPFTLSDFHVDTPWEDFKRGRVKSLSFSLRPKTNPFTLHFSGSLSWTHPRLQYAASIQFEGVDGALDALLWADLPSALREWNRPLALGIEATTPQLKHVKSGLEIGALKWNLLWKNETALLETQMSLAKILLQKGPVGEAHSTTVSLENIEGGLKAPLVFDPTIQVGPELKFRLRGASGEALLGERYLDLPLKAFPLQGDLTLSPENNVVDAQIDVGKKIRFLQKQNGLSLKIEKLPVEILLAVTAQWPELSLLRELELPASTLSLSLSTADSTFQSAEGNFELDAPMLKSRPIALQMKDIKTVVPFAWNSEALKIPNARISSGEVNWKRFRATLPPTGLQVSYLRKSQDLKILFPDGIPWKSQSLPFNIGRILGHARGKNISLTFPFDFTKTSLTDLGAGLCIPPQRLAPGFLSARFPTIEVTYESSTDDPDAEPELDVDFTGGMQIEAFGGKAILNEMGAYDITSPVPEVDFDARWSGFRLTEIGQWLGFGEMDGFAEGHALGVVFQSWLPTQFDFRFELKPHEHDDIVFSPEAMKNVVGMMAGGDAGEMFGPAGWLFFGAPSRLFGGYDIQYGGIQLTSADGAILLETLDPWQKRNHFILYGNRFKMPLNASHYPLLVDATSMSNFMRGKAQYFQNLQDAKKTEKGETHADTECLPENF